MKKTFILFFILLVALANNILADDGFAEEDVTSIATHYSVYKSIDYMCGDYVSLKDFKALVKKMNEIGLKRFDIPKSKWENFKDVAWNQAKITDDFLVQKQSMAYMSSSAATNYCLNVVDQLSGMYRGNIALLEAPSEEKRDF